MTASITNNARALLVGRRLAHLARLYRITRSDGAELLFTDHNRRLIFEGRGYDPAGAFNVSALEASEGLRVDNRSARGALAAGLITAAELEAGLYRDAEVRESIVDWRYPWAGALATRVFFIRSTRHGARGWEAELESRASLLAATVGERYSRTCRFTLGEPRCEIDLGNFTSFAVAVTDVSSDDLNPRSKVRAVSQAYHSTYAAGFADYGYLEFLSGDLAGQRIEVFQELRPVSPAPSYAVDFVLAEGARKDIQVGDSFKVVAGCDRTFATCGAKFDNKDNFGGFPFIPGSDAATRTIDAR